MRDTLGRDSLAPGETTKSVTVRDLTLNKTLALKKPKSYLAKKK